MALSQMQTIQSLGNNLAILQQEVEIFGVAATETRHLVGRIGELYAMLLVDKSDLHRSYKSTARAYFHGWELYLGKRTLNKHRKILLEQFKFDIFEPLPKIWKPLKNEPDDTFSDTQLTIVK